MHIEEKPMRADMPTNIRLTSAEQEALRRKAVEINKELVFNPLKSLCGFFGEVISEAKPDFPYPRSFASTLLETAHDQQFFSEHLPKLTDNNIKKIEHKKYVLDYLRFITFNQIK